MTGLDQTKARTSLTFAECAKQWLSTVTPQLKPSSALRRENSVAQLSPLLGAVLVRNLTTNTCEAWAAKRGASIAASTYNNERDTIIAILNYATREAPIYFLSHEQHFAKTTLSINLSSPEGQRAVTDYCEKERIEVIVIDNLSCLFSGMRENDADDWEFVLPWLMGFRRKGIAVCIVHHSGRNGANMRGTSRREDAVFWVMRLDPPSESDETSGACFIVSDNRSTGYPEERGGDRVWA